MQIKQINTAEQSVVIEFLGKERLVTFNGHYNGDIDIVPIGDLGEAGVDMLFNQILNNEEINAAFPYND